MVSADGRIQIISEEEGSSPLSTEERAQVHGQLLGWNAARSLRSEPTPGPGGHSGWERLSQIAILQRAVGLGVPRVLQALVGN